jgi:hypothetical protein
MNTLKLRIVMAFACCAVWCWGGGVALSQVRGTIGTLSTPGNLKTVGHGSNQAFRTYSSGGGGLQSTGGGSRGTSVLRSSMSGNSSFSLRSGIGGTGGGTSALRSNIDKSSARLGTGGSTGGGPVVGATLTAVRKGATFTNTASTPDFKLGSAGGRGMASTLLGQSTSLAAARGFIASVGGSSGLSDADESITTFVPDQPGQYRDKIHRGEELLKAHNYISAYEQFKAASDIVQRAPEPFLNMAHAKFGEGGYGMMAFYIRRALATMPQLPLVALRPKSFYENVAVYGDLMMRLETHLDDVPEDGDAQLILAYFRWFSETPEVATVQASLEKALAASQAEEKVEAINIFWRAIVKSGKASGELRTAEATTKPSSDASTAQPAAGDSKVDKDAL